MASKPLLSPRSCVLRNLRLLVQGRLPGARPWFGLHVLWPSVLGVFRAASGGTPSERNGTRELGPMVDTAPSPNTDAQSRAPKVMMYSSLPPGLSRAEGVRAQHYTPGQQRILSG